MCRIALTTLIMMLLLAQCLVLSLKARISWQQSHGQLPASKAIAYGFSLHAC